MLSRVLFWVFGLAGFWLPSTPLCPIVPAVSWSLGREDLGDVTALVVAADPARVLGEGEWWGVLRLGFPFGGAAGAESDPFVLCLW